MVMRRITAVATALALALAMTACAGGSGSSSGGASSSGEDYTTALFGKDVIKVEITADADEWQSLLDNATSKPTVKADVAIDGVTYADVAVKTKGNTSLTQVAASGSDRFSLKINFGKYVDGQTCMGLDKLALNNIYGDNTYLKEYMSYKLFAEMDVPASLCTFADVWVNGEHYGLLLALEDADDSYLARNFGADYTGEAYKPESMDMDGGNAGAAAGQGGGMQQPGSWPGADGASSSDSGASSADGTAPSMPTDGTAPSMPTDGTAPSMPTDGTAPSMPTDGTAPSMPTDGTAPSMPTDGTAPSMPDGFDPTQNQGGGGNAGGMGGGMDGGAKGVDLVYTDDDTDSYSNIFDEAITKVTEDDEARLIATLKAISEGEDLETYIDVDEVLRYAAVNVFLVNLDSYFSSMGHNYILYEDGGKLSMLPWDYNLAFGTFQSRSASSAVNYAIDTVFSGVTAEERPVIGKLLDNEEYLAKYHEYLRQVADYVTGGSFDAEVDRVASAIDSYVQADDTSFGGYDAFTSGVPALKTFAALRAQSVAGQLDGSIPSTTEAQSGSSALVDASALDLSLLGTMSN